MMVPENMSGLQTVYVKCMSSTDIKPCQLEACQMYQGWQAGITDLILRSHKAADGP